MSFVTFPSMFAPVSIVSSWLASNSWARSGFWGGFSPGSATTIISCSFLSRESCLWRRINERKSCEEFCFVTAAFGIATSIDEIEEMVVSISKTGTDQARVPAGVAAALSRVGHFSLPQLRRNRYRFRAQTQLPVVKKDEGDLPKNQIPSRVWGEFQPLSLAKSTRESGGARGGETPGKVRETKCFLSVYLHPFVLSSLGKCAAQAAKRWLERFESPVERGVWINNISKPFTYYPRRQL